MQWDIINSAGIQGAGLSWGFDDNEILSQRVLLSSIGCVVALHGSLHFVAGEVIPDTGHDEQLSLLRELSWSLLERFWSAEIPSTAILNLPLQFQPYQHGGNCRSRQSAGFGDMVDWGWTIINILKQRFTLY